MKVTVYTKGNSGGEFNNVYIHQIESILFISAETVMYSHKAPVHGELILNTSAIIGVVIERDR